MAQINFKIDDKIKAEAESEHAIPFAIRQCPPPSEYADELTSRIRDMEAGLNCHVHELIDVEDASRERSAMRRRGRHAKALA